MTDEMKSLGITMPATTEARFAAFLDHAPLGMYLLDEKGEFVIANTQMREVFDDPGETLVGRNFVEMVEPQTKELTRALLGSILDRQQIERGELERPRDRFRWTYTVRFPVTIEGQPRYVGGFILDISDRKAVEAELAKSLAALQHAEKLRVLSSLLAGVSHELNNPLSALIGQAIMLEEDTVGHAFAERAGRIRHAAERYARVFLAMARQKPPRRTSVDVAELVRAALDLLAFQLRSADICIETMFDGDVPPIFADADQLQQVIVNLLVNAAQALKERADNRCIRIAVENDEGGVALTVTDNGPGIPPEIASRIFEPFFTTKAADLGTGLGLAFSAGVVESHGGGLSLLPSEAGASFRVRLPVGLEAAEPAAFRMPGIDGLGLLARIAAERPALVKRLGFVTGDVMSPEAARRLAESGRPYIEKPVSASALLGLVATLGDAE